MRIKLKSILAVLVTVMLLNVSTQAAETGEIREFFACNYLEGKDIDDLMSARDFLVEQFDELGVDYGNTILWTPYKTNNELDFLWFNNYANLNQYGSQSEIFDDSLQGQHALQRFNNIVLCTSGLVTQEQIYDGGSPPVTSPSAMVFSAACTLRPGKTMADVTPAVNHYVQVLDDLGTHSAYVAYMQTPIISSAGRDVYFYGVYDSIAAYAARNTELLTSEGGVAVGAHFNEVLACETALWNGEIIIPGAN